MKLEKFAQNAIPIIAGIVILLLILYFLISEGFAFLLWALILIPVYFIPCFIAFKKKHKYKKQILLLNIFLGFSYVGWVAALIWASLDNEN